MTNLEANSRREIVIAAELDDRLTMMALRAVAAEFLHFEKMRRFEDVVEFVKGLDLHFPAHPFNEPTLFWAGLLPPEPPSLRGLPTMQPRPDMTPKAQPPEPPEL